jgi:HEAT repeat protein
VQLEALAALTQTDSDEWTSRVRDVAADTTTPLDRQIEAVFVLTELGTQRAVEALVEVAANGEGRHEEVRAAAVWGLGSGALPSPVAVALFLDDAADRVALHAAASLPDQLPEPLLDLLVGWLRCGNPRQSAVAAHVLARHNELQQLVDIVRDRDAAGRLNALNALGSLPRGQGRGCGCRTALRGPSGP